MRRATQQRSGIVALVAAIVFFAQSSLSVWAAAMHEWPRLDAFGNPLCIADASRQGDTSLQGHTQLQNCCAVGCSMVSSLLPAPEDDGIGIACVPPSFSAPFAPRSVFLPRPPSHEPRKAREPRTPFVTIRATLLARP